MPALTHNQLIFRDRLASRLGLSKAVVGAWIYHEQNGAAAQSYEKRGYYNWLNIGRTDTGDTGDAAHSIWSDPTRAADATVSWIKHKSAPAIRNALASARGKSPVAQATAIANSPWASSHYGGPQGLISLLGIGGRGSGGGGGGASPVRLAPATTTRIPGQTITTQIPTVDKAGFEQARKLALVGGLIARRNPNSFLLRSGLLSTQEPTLSNFMGSRTVKDVIPGATVRTPAIGQAQSGGSVPRVGGGHVAIAKGADRPGVSTQPIVKSFIGQVAGHAQRPITIGTGTNHNRMTTSGNVSDHWTGHAADLPQPVDSHQGDMVAAHALQVAGVPWSQAVRMAQKGGVFNVTPKSGPYKGHRVQVLWKTMVGGNHHNHVHVGIR